MLWWLEAISGHEEFLILGEVRRVVSRTAALDFGLLGGLVDRVPWEAALKG